MTVLTIVCGVSGLLTADAVSISLLSEDKKSTPKVIPVISRIKKLKSAIFDFTFIIVVK